MQSVFAGTTQAFRIKGTKGTLQRPYEPSKVRQTLANRFVQDLKKRKIRVTLEANNHKYVNPSLNTSPKPLHP